MSMLPSGVFFQSYAAEQGLLRTWPQRLGLAASLLLLASMGWLMNDYWLGILTLGGITLVAVLGLHITIGMAGLLNLGQSAFVGIGAFVATSTGDGLLARRWPPMDGASGSHCLVQVWLLGSLVFCLDCPRCESKGFIWL